MKPLGRAGRLLRGFLAELAAAVLAEGPASFIHRLAGRAGNLAPALVGLVEILLLRYDRRRE